MSAFARFDRPLVVVDYDDQWPIEFDREMERLSASLGDRPAVFEHIGSTSVPGLAAKPVIDIAIGIPDLGAAPEYIEVLSRLEYEYVPEFETGLPRRRFLWRGTQQVHTHHVHVTQVGDPLWIEPLAFRDYLRSDLAAAADYGALKQQLAMECGEDIAQYIAGKSDFVADVLRRLRLA